jgi:pSer/pThr/pTyr-binding forkhead associated (FHA) protein
VNETGEFSSILRLDEPSEDAAAAFLLTVAEGPDEGSTLLVDPSLPTRVFVGTSSSCELRLTDAEVSRRHIALEAIGEKLRVTDLGSANGTTADGVLLVEGFLRGAEVLRLGRTAIRQPRGAFRSRRRSEPRDATALSTLHSARHGERSRHPRR